jgi:hypothetical protein
MDKRLIIISSPSYWEEAIKGWEHNNSSTEKRVIDICNAVIEAYNIGYTKGNKQQKLIQDQLNK